MTVVAARIEHQQHKIDIVADTQATWGHGRIERVSKLMVFDEDYVVGGAGRADEITLMRLFGGMTRPRVADEVSVAHWLVQFNEFCTEHIGEKSQNSYLLLYQGHAFVIHGFDIQEVRDFAAIGSGADYALPAMFLGATAQEAVDAAIEFDAYCSGPTQSFEMSLETED